MLLGCYCFAILFAGGQEGFLLLLAVVSLSRCLAWLLPVLRGLSSLCAYVCTLWLTLVAVGALIDFNIHVVLLYF